MRYTQHFIVEGKHLGETPRPAVKYGAMCVGAPQAYAFFCPLCGEVWARCPVVDFQGVVQPFQATTKECRKHPDFLNLWTTRIPGSIFLSFDKEFTAALPEEALKRELLLHLDAIEKEQS